MEQLTEAEKSTNNETYKHIYTVQGLILDTVHVLLKRMASHDQSKLIPPEVSTFVEFTPKLKDSTYGSEEYKGFLKAMKPALDNHYACNRHHPEHFENGVNGMNIIDLIEMILDWKAATLRHADGDIMKSIEINAKRFGIDDQLKQILINTAKCLNGLENWGDNISEKAVLENS